MFKREDRYVVIKDKDLSRLHSQQIRNLEDILDTLNYYRGLRGPLKAVVVEHDWPEYETVWKMIETRMNNDKTS